MTTTGCDVLLDLHGCDVAVLADIEGLRELGLDLWRASMGAEAPGEPLVVRLASDGLPRGAVVSLVELGPGASIVAHFSESDATAAISVLSRTGVDDEGIEALARECLGASGCERRVITGRMAHL